MLNAVSRAAAQRAARPALMPSSHSSSARRVARASYSSGSGGAQADAVARRRRFRAVVPDLSLSFRPPPTPEAALSPNDNPPKKT
jgi:hypothetical protein